MSNASSYFFDRRLAKGESSSYVIDKERSCDTFINYMNIRLQKMFCYDGLPDTMPKEMLEYYLLNNGTSFVTEVDGKQYAFCGSFGGEPDPYYRPTRYIVANPALKLTKEYDIEKDGVLVRNDTLWVGLYPLMARYATLMAENMLTIRTADIMLRVMALLTAPDDRTKVAAEEYLKKLQNGELGVIGENRFFDEGVKLQSPPSNNGSYLTQFIELHQYLTGTFYNEIGLNANFNMKRESIGEGESSLNEESLLPLADEMLRCRKEDMEKINKMFGTNITVEFDSSWANNRKEIELSLQVLEKEASQLAEGDENNEQIESEQAESGAGTTGDSTDGTVTEDNTGTEHDTDEHNDSSTDETRGGNTDEDVGGDQGTDVATGDNSEESGEDVLVSVEIDVLVDEQEKEDYDGRDSKD
jgi:hypothetical protein